MQAMTAMEVAQAVAAERESGEELFMKPSTASSGKRSNGTKGAKANGRCADDDGELPSGALSSMVYTHMHLGMRNNADAPRLLRKG